MRNPWGKGEWNGDWSNNSKLWTLSLRKKYRVERTDDGVFYMPYEAYLENFSATTFCMEYAASYKHSSINHSFESAEDKSIQQAAFFQFFPHS